jgi:hypothetical protein
MQLNFFLFEKGSIVCFFVTCINSLISIKSVRHLKIYYCMKKITFLLIFSLLGFFGVLNAAGNESVPEYIVNETFTGATAYPSGWADATTLIGANNAGVSWTTPAADQLNVAGSGTGTRGRTIGFPTSGSESKVYVDMNFFVTSSTIGNRNALGIILHDNAGSNILSLYACGNAGKWYYWNNEKDSVTFTGSSFTRAGADNTITNTRNSGSIIELGYATGVWFNLKAELDFATKQVVTMTLKNLSTEAEISSNGKPFLNSSAADLTKISVMNTRGSSAGNGSNANLNISLDNFKVYKMVEVAGFADVTINYLDQNGDVAKVARVAAGQAIGVPYVSTTDDKLSFTANGNYYAYDAANTVADQVVVAEGGSVINLKFKKTAVTAGTYSWTGNASANWNEIDANFTTDNVNALGYQNSNAIAFGAAGTQKAVTLTGAINTGDQDIVVSADGYAFSGTGSVAGTGSLILNLSGSQTASVNVTNSLTGGVVVNGGTAVLLKDAAATKLTIADGATVNLNTGATFNKAIQAAGTISLIPTANVVYSSAITGATQVNYSLLAAGSVNSGGTYSAMPILDNTVPADAKVHVSNTLETPAMFGTRISYAGVKVELGANVDMVYAQNPNSDGSTTVAIGELSGAETSKLKGNRIGRIVTYNVGASNTNAVFAGKLENFEADQWGNIGVLNVTKVGTGKLTLSGASTGYVNGSVAVNAGELEVSGTLGTATTPVTVGADGTLSGTGTVGGAATINGTLKGRLNFAGALTLAGTTELTVAGFASGEYDVITVAGNLARGGNLNVNITALPPAVGTKIKMIDAVSSTGTFAGITVPAGYSFDESTGELTRDFGSSLNETAGFRIYPTRVSNEVIVEGQGIAQISLYNISGQLVKTISAVNERNTISMNQLANGAYLLKVGFADGSVKVQNILLQK